MIVQIRESNTGKILKAQQISDDAGRIQCDNLAGRLVTNANASPRDCYWVAVAGDCTTAIHRGEFEA